MLLKGSNGLERIREPQYTKIKGTIIFCLPLYIMTATIANGLPVNNIIFASVDLFSHQNTLFHSVRYFFLNAFL